jgi:hypothetical protein
MAVAEEVADLVIDHKMAVHVDIALVGRGGQDPPLHVDDHVFLAAAGDFAAGVQAVAAADLVDGVGAGQLHDEVHRPARGTLERPLPARRPPPLVGQDAVHPLGELARLLLQTSLDLDAVPQHLAGADAFG